MKKNYSKSSVPDVLDVLEVKNKMYQIFFR